MEANSSSDQSYRRNRRYNNSDYYPHNEYQTQYQNYDNNYYYDNQSVNHNNYYPNGQYFPQQISFNNMSNDRQMANRSQNDSNVQSLHSNTNHNKPSNYRNRDHFYRDSNYYRNSNKTHSTTDGNVGTKNKPIVRKVNEVNDESLSGANANTSTQYSNNGSNSNNNVKHFHKKESNYDKTKKSYSDNRAYDRGYDRRYNNLSEKNKKFDDRKDKDRNELSNKSKSNKRFESDESQREIMDEMLRKGEYECMVCCDEIKIRDSIWNCEHCFNIFHLKCVKMWANSESSNASQSKANDISWRCPACQTPHKQIPYKYQCFCGKRREPELNRYLVPHSCGEMCGRKRKTTQQRKHECPHKCLILCHPGPCPPCQSKITRECACGKTQISVNCATNDDEVICNNVCNKVLQCGRHHCQSVCHSGKCNNCEVIKIQMCFCGKDKREVSCNAETGLIEMYSCQTKCDKTLNCGNHKCEKLCHNGVCNECSLDPNLITHCPCGKTELFCLTKTIRKTCKDPIQTCNEICDKELVCGPNNSHHRCKKKCHSGECPVCDLRTVIRCRCGANSENVECLKLFDKQNGETNSFICKKRCNKKRLCSRHKCLNECCVVEEHVCQQVCGKKLSCGSHTCEEMCHSGNCGQCWNVSWDELTCRCGHEIKLPPIACGTKRPECNQICSRRHPCDHKIDHNCHDDDECPPCTYLILKPCYGEHEQRTAPCYQNGVSCGYACGKPLDCGLHRCEMICHEKDCGQCRLPCNKVRKECEHICNVVCHQKTSKDCPKSNCKVLLNVSCDCGRRTDKMQCFKVNDENSFRLSLNALANTRIKNGESVNISDIMKNIKDMKHFQLKCDEKCAVMERNRQLAEALDIKDADFSPDPGPPKYSDMLKNAARTDPTFVADVFEKLTQLVLDSKQSKLTFKIINFPPMNSENRHLIHELSEFFGCKTHAVDREPNRSVVVKATKDKCYLPTVHLMDFIKDETELKNKTSNKITLKNHCFDQQNNETNIVSNKSIGMSLFRNTNDSNDSVKKTHENEKVVDYFDFKGD